MVLSVIIVSYNVKYFLEQCLCSVQRALVNEAEVFVIDNHSSDGTLEYLREKFPFVQFISNHENVGFAKANNQLLEKATGKYVLFLNPDTIIPEDLFTKCIAFLQSHADAGALGVRMIDGSGKFLKESKRGFPSPWVAFCKMSGLAKIFARSNTFS
jgi:N-acetylglucosaminyl-diphospho-decaprenol L-rhamnosyltransferase